MQLIQYFVFITNLLYNTLHMGREVPKCVVLPCCGGLWETYGHTWVVVYNQAFMFEQQKPRVLGEFKTPELAEEKYGRNNVLINAMFSTLCPLCRESIEEARGKLFLLQGAFYKQKIGC